VTDTPALAVTLKRRLEAAANVVTEAQRAVEAGEQVDLSGLEREVDEICTGLGGLPAGAGGDIRLALVILMDDLERLTAALTAAHHKLVDDMGGLSARQRATKAYGQPQE